MMGNLQFSRLRLPVIAVVGALLATTAQAEPPFDNSGPPMFAPALYADGDVWGTKLLSPLPPPNGSNDQSFDALYIVTNGADGQLGVGEAAPGNPDYNGGRWETVAVTWLAAGMTFYSGNLPVLTSSDQIFAELDQGHLELGGHPAGPPPYFLCPLLPSMVPANG